MEDVDMADSGGDMEDAASRAAEHIRATIRSLRPSSSPAPALGSFSYERDPQEWLRRATEGAIDDDYLMEPAEVGVPEDDDDPERGAPTRLRLPPAVSTPKRPAAPQRSNTPVMSNQSKRSKAVTPAPVLSPPYQGLSPSAAVPTLDIVRRSVPSLRSSHVEYQRCYEATGNLLDVTRRLTAQTAPPDGPPERDPRPAARRAELEFLQALQRAAWDAGAAAPPETKQGNFWLLLGLLRRIEGDGTDFLWWDDAEAAQRRRRVELECFKEELAARVAEHPRALLERLREPSAPAAVRRHVTILRWLEACFNHVLPAGVTRPRQVRYLEDSPVLRRQGLPETDKDAELFACSLALLLAGRASDAQELWRDSNVPWRAIAFAGEAPHGYVYSENPETGQVEHRAVGNERRALWRRFQWIKAKKAVDKEIAVCCEEQTAVHAILGCNVKAALQNPKLRSWEKGLYVAFRSVWGRLEDEILYRHNNSRREKGPFPGTQYEKSEMDHLSSTSDFANWDETQIVVVLESTPFQEMKCDDAVSQMTAKFLMGKSAVSSFLRDCAHRIEDGEIKDEFFLRFIVHLLIYLDELAVIDGASLNIPDLNEMKELVLQRYLHKLGSREDFWYLRVLYASLLAPDNIRKSLPPLLVPIDSPLERQTVVNQLRDYLTQPGLDLEILRRVVGGVLAEDSLADMGPDTPSPLDLRKMDAVRWLWCADAHLGDALEFTNALLRQFLLADKLASVELFVDDVLCGTDGREREMLEYAYKDRRDDANDDPDSLEALADEYSAHQLLLLARRGYRAWEETLAQADPRPVVVDDQVDADRLRGNPTSVAIARRMQDRALLQEKRSVSGQVRAAAQAAREALAAVLTCPGGWLAVEQEGAEGSDGPEAMVVHGEDPRRAELLKLRSKYLVQLVMWYYKVCIETAAWMSRSLNDAVERLHGDLPLQVLASLDDSAADADGGTALAPWYWTAQAVDLMDTIVSDAYEIQPACDVVALKAFADKAAEVTIMHMMYESNRH